MWNVFSNRLTMEMNIKQWYVIQFWVLLKKSPTEMLTMLREAFKDGCALHAMCFRWHLALLKGRETAEDNQWEGRRITAISEIMVNTANVNRMTLCFESKNWVANSRSYTWTGWHPGMVTTILIIDWTRTTNLKEGVGLYQGPSRKWQSF